jgi:hypothetical protein
MNMIKSIGIPEPCSQQWQQMTSVDGGRHCDNCRKTVIDFTRMTDAEIINHFATKSNTCGKFTGDQLSRINQSLTISEPRGKFWKYLGIAAFVAGLFSTIKVDAQARKAKHVGRATLLNIQKDTSPRHLITDSLSSKASTVANVNIDTRAKQLEVKDFLINRECTSVSYLLGGVITGITIHEESRNSYMSIWDML